MSQRPTNPVVERMVRLKDSWSDEVDAIAEKIQDQPITVLAIDGGTGPLSATLTGLLHEALGRLNLPSAIVHDRARRLYDVIGRRSLQADQHPGTPIVVLVLAIDEAFSAEALMRDLESAIDALQSAPMTAELRIVATLRDAEQHGDRFASVLHLVGTDSRSPERPLSLPQIQKGST